MTAAVAYESLLLEYTPRPIHTVRAHRKALKQVDELMRGPLGPAEKELIELLSTLISQYEARAYPSPDVTPGQMLEHLLDAREITRAELARQAGIPRSTVTNVISGTRGISKANAAKLAAFFNVSPALFIDGAE